MTWPDYFPDNCPPANAQPTTSALVFLFIRKGQPTADDFRSYKEKNPQNSFRNPCKACGLSVFTDRDDERIYRDKIPGFRRRRLVQGRLKKRDGLIKSTPSTIPSHHTWWIPKEAKNLQDSFKLVAA